jgi:hypothetical protein
MCIHIHAWILISSFPKHITHNGWLIISVLSIFLYTSTTIQQTFMIHIYGDSHGDFSFRNLHLPSSNHHCSSVTMFRIGRDNIIVNFNKDDIKKDDILVLSYGEVDCRCHVQRQIDLGQNEDDVINELVTNYIKTIQTNVAGADVKVIIVGVVPQTRRDDYERIHGPIMHEFPFVGSDEDRVRYTNKVNAVLERVSTEHQYFYFGPYSYYAREDGTLKHELSDTIVHLNDNSVFLEKFVDLCTKISTGDVV